LVPREVISNHKVMPVSRLDNKLFLHGRSAQRARH
jgi:hypothetical protein